MYLDAVILEAFRLYSTTPNGTLRTTHEVGRGRGESRLAVQVLGVRSRPGLGAGVQAGSWGWGPGWVSGLGSRQGLRAGVQGTGSLVLVVIRAAKGDGGSGPRDRRLRLWAWGSGLGVQGLGFRALLLGGGVYPLKGIIN